jgi:hypothetical protein
MGMHIYKTWRCYLSFGINGTGGLPVVQVANSSYSIPPQRNISPVPGVAGAIYYTGIAYQYISSMLSTSWH